MQLIILGLGILVFLYLIISLTDEKIIFVAVSPYFVFQLADDIFGIKLSGISSGGASSPLQIGICVLISGVILVMSYLQYSARSNSPFEFLRTPLIAFAWAGFFFLQCVTIYLDPSKWVPISSLLCFTISTVSLFVFGSDLEKVMKALIYWGLICSAVIIYGVLSGKTWTVSDYNFSDSLYDKTTYFSPLSELIGLPIRNNFYFNSGPQILGITFALLFSVALGIRSSLLKWISLAVFIIIGSLSGSRTFYIVVILLVLLQIVIAQSKFIDLNLLKGLLIVLGISFSVYYILSIRESNIGIATINGRSIIWSLITAHWNDNSLLGHGPGTLEAFARNSYTFFPFVHAHNSYLQLLWDFGLVGLFFALLISALAIYSLDWKSLQGFTLCTIGLCVVQTEITLEASVMNPFPIFWVTASLQLLHKIRFYVRNEV